MNLFEQPKIITFDQSGLALPRYNGLTWIEKDWYLGEEAELRIEFISKLTKAAEKIASQSSINYADAVNVLNRPTSKNLTTEMTPFLPIMVKLQSEQASTQIESDHRFAALILSTRLDDNWLHDNIQKIQTYYLNEYPSWKNKSTDQIWAKLNCQNEEKARNKFRLESLRVFTKKMPPGLFLKIIEFCEFELNYGIEETSDIKKTSAPTKSNGSDQKKLEPSTSAV